MNRRVLARSVDRKSVRASVVWIDICMGTFNPAILPEVTTG
jgi:hypothetical protein